MSTKVDDQTQPDQRSQVATEQCPRCGNVTQLAACSSGACRNCGFRPSCSMG